MSADQPPTDGPEPTTTGARALLQTLVDTGVGVCFMNPGTSEMHVVQALDSTPGMHGVLALFEGVATGAADGWARVTGTPAAVLLHLGPGLGNGLANLHNARRAHTPVLCVVGAHATSHERLDAPLQSDIAAAARTVSGWVHTTGTTRALADDAARAVVATHAGGGQVATLVLPADVSWSDGARPVPPRPVPARVPAPETAVRAAAAATAAGPDTVLLLGGAGLTAASLAAADRIAAATGVRVLAETFPARMERGEGVPHVERVAYLAEAADAQLAGTRTLLLAGAASPVAFFAYPGRRGDLVPEDCDVLTLADVEQDVEATLLALAEAVAPGTAARPAPHEPPTPAPGPLTVESFAAAVAATMPDHAIVVDEANTSGFGLPAALARAARHTLLTLTGGAIGQGLPVATGAAVAAPDRPVLCLEADGSALYTLQALWTMARERLDVTTVVVNNGAYAILRMELARTGAADVARGAAARMLDLTDPTPDFVALATGFGVPATRATTSEELVDQLRAAYRDPGPHLIEAIVPPVV